MQSRPPSKERGLDWPSAGDGEEYGPQSVFRSEKVCGRILGPRSSFLSPSSILFLLHHSYFLTIILDCVEKKTSLKTSHISRSFYLKEADLEQSIF